MIKSRHLYLLAFTVICSTTYGANNFCLAKEDSAVAEKIWVMEQIQSSAGRHKIYWNSEFVKIEGPYNITMLGKTPFTEETSYRTDEKVFHKNTFTAFKAIFDCTFNDKTSLNRGFIKEKTEQKMGMQIVTYKISSALGPLRLSYIEQPEAPIGVCDFISAYWRSPRAKGILIAISRVGKIKAPDKKIKGFSILDLMGEDPANELLRTVSIKQIPLNTADFSVPSGYKAVPSVRYMPGPTKTRVENDMLNELDLGRDFGSAK